MKVKEYREIFNTFHVGDIAWACAFERTYSTKDMLFRQEPILGMFVSRKYLEDAKNVKTYESVRYFVPFKKKAQTHTLTDLAWSKLVNVSSRKYATTEYECKELYNELIDDEIFYHKNLIDEMESYHI